MSEQAPTKDQLPPEDEQLRLRDWPYRVLSTPMAGDDQPILGSSGRAPIPTPADHLRALLEVSRYCVRNELNRTEQQILAIEKSKPTPVHLNPTRHLATLNQEAERLRLTLEGIESFVGLGTKCGAPLDADGVDRCERRKGHFGVCGLDPI